MRRNTIGALVDELDRGRLSRRQFLARASLLGVSLGAASALYATRAGEVAAQATPAGGAAAAPATGNIDWQQASGQTLRVPMQTHPTTTAIMEVLPEFEALTGIKVQIEELDWSVLHEKILTDFQSGSGTYDAVMHGCYTTPLYAKNGWVEDLTTYLDDSALTDKSWFDVDDLFAPSRELLTWEEGQFGLPVYSQSDLLYYRTDLYESAGLAVPETLEEYAANAQTLNNPPSLYGTAMWGSKDQSPPIFFIYLHAFGGEYLDADWNPTINNEAGVAALTAYADILKTAGPPGIASWGFPETNNAFTAALLGHTLQATVFAPGYQEETAPVRGKVGYAVTPKGPVQRGYSTFAMSLAISSRTERKTAAWLFIQWALSKGVCKATTLSGDRGDSPRASTWTDPEVRGVWDALGMGEWADITLEGMTKAVYPNASNPVCTSFEPRFPEYLQTRDHLGAAISSVLAGSDEPKVALDKAAQQIRAVLEHAGYYNASS